MTTMLFIYFLLGAVLVLVFHKSIQAQVIDLHTQLSLEAGRPIPYWIVAAISLVLIVVAWPAQVQFSIRRKGNDS